MAISKIKDMSLSSTGGAKSSITTTVNASTLGTFTNPAKSAQQLYDLGVRVNGLYWLQPDSWSYPAQFYCEMLRCGGGWIYMLQKQCTNGSNGGPIVSMLTAQFGTQNHATSDFHGVVDSAGNAKTPQDIWNGFIGSGNNAKVYVREIQTSGFATYQGWDESQAYMSNTDTAVFSWTNYARLFANNFPTGGTQISGIRVYYDNGSKYVDNKNLNTWGDNLITISNAVIDRDLWYMNGRNQNDSNWSFGLTKGGQPYPRVLPVSYGGNRNNTTRWAIYGIKA